MTINSNRRRSAVKPLRLNGLVAKATVVIILFACTLVDSRAESVTALQFDGKNDFIDISPGVALGSKFTEEAWILPQQTDERFHGFLGFNAPHNIDRAPGMWVAYHTALHAGFGDGTNFVGIVSQGDVVVPNAWNHVATTYDGATYRVFANGVQVASKAFRATPCPQSVGQIGRVDNFFVGAMRDVRLWNRALTAAEIRQQMTTPLRGTEPGLVAYFPLDDGLGQQARNSVPQGPTGKLMNGPRWITSSAPVAHAIPAEIKAHSPTGDNVAPDATIAVTLHGGRGNIDAHSLELSLDETRVETVVTTNSVGELQIQYEPAALLTPASEHTVKLSYATTGGTAATNLFSYAFSVTPSVVLSP